MSDGFERLLKTLNQSELEMTSYELADLCWLLLHSPQIVEPIESKKPVEVTSSINHTPSSPSKVKQPEPGNEKEVKKENQKKPAAKLFPQQPRQDSFDGGSSLTFPVDNPSDIGSSLSLARALKALLRRVPAQCRPSILDEVETVETFAATDQKILTPIFKPALEPWLELVLVFDRNSSMDIWHQTLLDLKTVLQHYGIFRDVQVWQVALKEKKTVLYKGLNKTNSRVSHPKELLNPNGRRIILVVSDCVASYWQDGEIFPLLELWSQSSPLAILQMLPEWLWLKTGLGFGAKVTLFSDEPGLNNRRLKIRDVLLWENVFHNKNRLQIPVFTLEPLSIERWSRVVVGRSDTKVAGFVLIPHTKEESDTAAELNLPPERIVRRFRNNASLLVQELAELLAAAPTIFLPVVRLIRKEMLPEAGQVQIAEVFLGGILRMRSSEINETDPDTVLYDFISPEVRKILQCSSTRSTTVDVFDRVSKYIAKRLNLSLRDFLAELKKPPSEVDQEKQHIIRSFAEVAVEILRNLGGKYADFAEEINLNKGVTILDKNELFFQNFTGEYTCAVKWGGKTGTWQRESEPEHLLIYPQGEVQFRSRFGLAVIKNLTVEGQKLSWSFDDNQTAASIHFMENSENNYFWSENQTGKLFEGWLNYPQEGRIDFRGRFVNPVLSPVETIAFRIANINLIDDSITTQQFNFQVAIIKVHRPNLVNSNNILENLDQAVFDHTEKHLTDIEKLILEATLGTDKQTYQKIATSSNYTESPSLDKLGRKLWETLTEVIGKKVTETKINKSNAKRIINEWAARSHLTIDRYSAEATGFIENLGNETQAEMMLIPGGSFIMGSPPDEMERLERESPQDSVTVQSFFLAKYPVTQAQWRFIAQLPKVKRELKPDPSRFKGANRPVESVSWHDAVEFCSRLSQYTGKPYRLPSEAEWEYACRAGTTTPFHFGETITTDLANYRGTDDEDNEWSGSYGQGPKGTYRKETTEVGSFKVANNFGLYDMHGNVWEWCQDHWHDSYEGAPIDGSAWQDAEKDDNDYRMLRGGSWVNDPENCRSACRLNFNAGDSSVNNGFRVACAAAWTQ
ncbi:SAV_2336 N-terminal domain-related protein [Nodularia spumigena CS-586/05]|uniref:SAV_2336 N-terminal domain-related protein n=1 Tax=Nodularia spumigena TaxID=70799 RepID=UPI00232BE5DB|nr:SAV_2336 N-terminal domain-related protein [Nodularia spumigena]MDB9343409.1 SAV_2336 N-terminal domain-related protein [Nodularia spumigena CS-588/06]MDB9369142.1 SAV_2336 N-terminal domain-related protein [Nodularia spumigena CS-586/05]